MAPFQVRFKREKRAFRADPRKRRFFGAFPRVGCDIFAAGQAVTNPAFCADYRARQQSNPLATYTTTVRTPQKAEWPEIRNEASTSPWLFMLAFAKSKFTEITEN